MSYVRVCPQEGALRLVAILADDDWGRGKTDRQWAVILSGTEDHYYTRPTYSPFRLKGTGKQGIFMDLSCLLI